jgi:plasmid stabilization system protein ParE
MRVRFHVKARVEILEIVEHYENTADSNIASDFFSKLRYLVDRIAERPESFPLISPTLRKAVLRQFPYQIVFEKLDKGTVKS